MKRSILLSTAILALGLSAAVAAADASGDQVAGKTAYATKCLICHGKTGDGQGPAGAALDPKPNDFTSAAWWQGRSDASIKAAIKAGVPGTSMRAYPGLSTQELNDLLAYLESFKPSE